MLFNECWVLFFSCFLTIRKCFISSRSYSLNLSLSPDYSGQLLHLLTACCVTFLLYSFTSFIYFIHLVSHGHPLSCGHSCSCFHYFASDWSEPAAAWSLLNLWITTSDAAFSCANCKEAFNFEGMHAHSYLQTCQVKLARENWEKKKIMKKEMSSLPVKNIKALISPTLPLLYWYSSGKLHFVILWSGSSILQSY